MIPTISEYMEYDCPQHFTKHGENTTDGYKAERKSPPPLRNTPGTLRTLRGTRLHVELPGIEEDV